MLPPKENPEGLSGLLFVLLKAVFVLLIALLFVVPKLKDGVDVFVAELAFPPNENPPGF